MTAGIRKYNPGFLTDSELAALFCVRTHQFDAIIEMLRECTGRANTHQMVIGPRGSGKTTLLLRVVAELHTDKDLSSRFYPIVFAEESYEVSTAGEFWLEALSRLAVQESARHEGKALRRSWEDLRTVRDDRALGHRCLGALLDFADLSGRRLVLVVENLNAVFEDMMDPDEAGWRLRKPLQAEPRILLLASATSRFEAIDNPDRALYDLFRILSLQPLDTDECAVLWKSVSGQRREPSTVRALRILTGGNPRLLAILARFGSGRSFRELMANLLDLVDDHTEYFRSHLEALAAQERRVYLALADLWKPATTREIAERARLDTSKCSAQLTRLAARGAVDVAGGSPRRKLYYLTERLYNIYYLMRRARGPVPLIEALVRFMASYYAPAELKDVGVRIASETDDLDSAMQSLHRTAFMKLIALPALEPYRRELLGVAPPGLVETSFPGTTEEPAPRTSDLDEAWALFNTAFSLVSQNRQEEALAVCDEAMRRFGDTESVAVLKAIARVPVYKAAVLVHLDRPEAALAVYDEVVRRFGRSDEPSVLSWVVRAYSGKGATLKELDQRDQALAVYDEALHRYGECEAPVVLVEILDVLIWKGVTLETLNRWPQAIATYDWIVRRYGDCQSSHALWRVGKALVRKGMALEVLDQPDDAIAAYNEVVRRDQENPFGSDSEVVAQALLNKGGVLAALKRPQDAIAACDDVVRRFKASVAPEHLRAVTTALIGKGMALDVLERTEESLIVWDEIVRRLETREVPDDPELLGIALVQRGTALVRLNRPEDGLADWEEVVRRFGVADEPGLAEWVGIVLLKKAAVELTQRRYGEAVQSAGQALDAFGTEQLESRLRGYLIRALATLASGDRAAHERDLMAVLALLPDSGVMPREVLDGLTSISLVHGPELMRKRIIASPAAALLLPLTTALERELGIESRVAKEVEEVAEDIRRDLAKLRAGALKPVRAKYVDCPKTHG